MNLETIGEMILEEIEGMNLYSEEEEKEEEGEEVVITTGIEEVEEATMIEKEVLEEATKIEREEEVGITIEKEVEEVEEVAITTEKEAKSESGLIANLSTQTSL